VVGLLHRRSIPKANGDRGQYDIAGTLGTGSWDYIAGTYDKNAGPDNQRLYLNGVRVAQMSDTLPSISIQLHLVSATM
jgi:hypothetical protein